ncbi:hypothetical protein DQ04_10241000 [Trypanosoma grayi]|uniref:hypothetical protein n=1 Tax=Trypanosoma grayi TaxID=71804 RepID=UPI0004F478B8|nr:hypothetical protein DQ04_10241000 [Trypanosoma grayi]KEG07303.1 hypothetical protein DQ04_10241000 [Trypanosoma grayi]
MLRHTQLRIGRPRLPMQQHPAACLGGKCCPSTPPLTYSRALAFPSPPPTPPLLLQKLKSATFLAPPSTQRVIESAAQQCHPPLDNKIDASLLPEGKSERIKPGARLMNPPPTRLLPNISICDTMAKTLRRNPLRYSSAAALPPRERPSRLIVCNEKGTIHTPLFMDEAPWAIPTL